MKESKTAEALKEEKRKARWEKEEERIRALSYYEDLYHEKYKRIAGIDEVGRGPLAGPVLVSAVILPMGFHLHGVNDSKKLSPKKREELSGRIMETAEAYSFASRDEKRIDEVNILNATKEAMREAIMALDPLPDLVLVDAVTIPDLPIPQKAIIKGDAKSITIASASILAKVKRDHYMVDLAETYPEYSFEKNKGYGTKEHITALKKYGPCPAHRLSFIGHFI